MDTNDKKKFFEKGWFAALMLFLFSPVGIFLLWKYHRKHKVLNIILTCVFGFFFLIVVIAIFSPSESLEEISRQDIERRNQEAAQTQQGQQGGNQASTVTSTPAPEPETETTHELQDEGIEADGIGGGYDYSGYNEIVGDFVTYVNDGFSLSVPSNSKISSEVDKEAVNQFSISEGAEVPTEKIYKVEFIYGVADVNVQINIFPNEGADFSTTNITVPNADGAYLHENISDSILETSKYELKVVRGDLVYILETTYEPSVALMGQAKGQEDFSYERELLKNLLDTFKTMINSFSLTDNPVSFDTIAKSGTYWQENVIDLIR